eukprot:CAMPEP_0206303748 /NCGR_PEP_ID=MMETSP0106_2-20121207/9393_1 /ASSEMBLY_ACC=CAM_ASM_000206 /TAXON_ID=81532 /ORGANISM="Acanthoeca-like sp., Strain 10tr" /LENGTH=921 /DNA_ID=CAMNT_0053734545 /DNA_START=139 /DNA_END=2905 /DNA_ORIENTATION=+
MADEAITPGNVFDHYDPNGTGEMEVRVIEEVLTELFRHESNPQRAAPFLDKLHRAADANAVNEIGVAVITREQFIELAVSGDSLFGESADGSTRDVVDLFTVLCSKLRVTVLPIVEAITLCHRIGECTADVATQVAAEMVARSNGKVITETDITEMSRSGVFDPILYPAEDKHLAPAVVHRRASAPLIHGVSSTRGSVEAVDGRPRSQGGRRRSVRRSGIRRFASVRSGSQKSRPGTSERPSTRGSKGDHLLPPTLEGLEPDPLNAPQPQFEGLRRLSSDSVLDEDTDYVEPTSTPEPTKDMYLRNMFESIVGRHKRMHQRHFLELLQYPLCQKLLPKNPSGQLMERIFCKLDRDGGGYIELNEFKLAFNSVIDDTGEFVGFKETNFPDACLYALIVEMENQGFDMEEATSRYTDELRRHVDMIAKSKVYQSTLERDNSDLQDEIARLTELIQDLKKKSVSVGVRLDDSDSKIDQQRLLVAERELKKSKEDGAKLRTQRDRLDIENSTLHFQIDELEARTAEMTGAMDRLAHFEQQGNDLEDVAQKLRANLESKDATIKQLNEELQQAVDSLQVAEAARDEATTHVKSLQHESANFHAEIARLQSALKKEITEHEASTARGVELSAEIEQLNARLKAMGPAMLEGDKRSANLLEQLEGLRGEKASLQIALDKANLQAQEFSDMSEKAADAHEHAMARLEELQHNVDVLLDQKRKWQATERVVRKYKRDVAHLKSKVDELYADTESLRSMLSESENAVSQKLKMNNVLTRRNVELEAASKVSSRALLLKDEEIKQLSHAAQSLKAEKGRIAEDLSATRADLVTTQAKLRAALELMESTTGQLENLRLKVDDKSIILEEHFGNISGMSRASPQRSPDRRSPARHHRSESPVRSADSGGSSGGLATMSGGTPLAPTCDIATATT